jgi:hypothetical protein
MDAQNVVQRNIFSYPYADKYTYYLRPVTMLLEILFLHGYVQMFIIDSNETTEPESSRKNIRYN